MMSDVTILPEGDERGPGAPTLLDDELTPQIRKLVVEGFSYKEIRTTLNISEGTWDSWIYRDTHGFRAKLMQWKAERFLDMAEKNMPELLVAKSENVRADMTKFILETAGKEAYAKRQESTGKDGKPQETMMTIITKVPDPKA